MEVSVLSVGAASTWGLCRKADPPLVGSGLCSFSMYVCLSEFSFLCRTVCPLLGLTVTEQLPGYTDLSSCMDPGSPGQSFR